MSSASFNNMSNLSSFILKNIFYVFFRETEAGGKTPESLTPILRDKSVHAVGWSFALQCLSNLFLSHKTIHLNARTWIPPGHKKGGETLESPPNQRGEK